MSYVLFINLIGGQKLRHETDYQREDQVKELQKDYVRGGYFDRRTKTLISPNQIHSVRYLTPEQEKAEADAMLRI
jgi:hypothetical protein